MDLHGSSLGPQQNLVVEGWGCMLGEVKRVGVAGICHILDMTRGEQKQGQPRGWGWGCGRQAPGCLLNWRPPSGEAWGHVQGSGLDSFC